MKLKTSYPEIHVKDGLNKKDSSAYLGEGETDFAGTMEVLKKANYKGWLHLENFYDRKPLCDTGELHRGCEA